MATNPASDVPFRLEDQLLEIVFRQFDSRLRTSRRVTAKRMKVAVGMIVPDLVLVMHPASVAPKNLKSFRLTLFDCGMLAKIISTREPSLEKLANEIMARRSVIQSSLTKLSRYRLITMRGSRLNVPRRVRFQSGRIVSVEAKLIRWRDAIEQAKTYLRFSNSAYIAVPAPLIAKNRAIRAACVTARIGLVAVENGKCTVSLRAPIHISKTGEWIWVLNKTAGFEY